MEFENHLWSKDFSSDILKDFGHLINYKTGVNVFEVQIIMSYINPRKLAS